LDIIFTARKQASVWNVVLFVWRKDIFFLFKKIEGAHTASRFTEPSTLVAFQKRNR
jgi:hypothetical protein